MHSIPFFTDMIADKLRILILSYILADVGEC